jgi:ribosome-binding protein aMBF1 (putative translation factor)
MNIAWTLISDYERGKLRLHDKVLRKFAMALEVSTDEILGIAREKHPNPSSPEFE